jgi:hypothetical protein
MAAGLSARLSKMVLGGRHLNDDSKHSESRMQAAIRNIILPYAKAAVERLGGKLEHRSSMSLYECQKHFGRASNEENKRVCMRPDGGVFMAVHNGVEVPILIIEDKVQGTNDTLHAAGKARQATGNAIERAAKNIRMSEMLFAGRGIFPYVIFAAGCDFHPSETIAKRLEAMNFGVPNHSFALEPETTEEEVAAHMERILADIHIDNIAGKSVASIFVKSHKYDKMEHGASCWTPAEMGVICCHVIDMVIAASPGLHVKAEEKEETKVKADVKEEDREDREDREEAKSA